MAEPNDDLIRALTHIIYEMERDEDYRQGADPKCYINPSFYIEARFAIFRATGSWPDNRPFDWESAFGRKDDG